jgi:hypothetical protein
MSASGYKPVSLNGVKWACQILINIGSNIHRVLTFEPLAQTWQDVMLECQLHRM